MPKPPERTKSAKSSEEREWPLKWVALALMAFIAALCWGLAAASYAINVEGWRSGVGQYRTTDGPFDWASYKALDRFLYNALEQVPNAPQVLGYAVTDAWWVLILFVVLESLACLFWWKARALEKEFAAEDSRRGR